jgi:antitoxin component YwqK of YwqJK toxin-antitoxin module
LKKFNSLTKIILIYIFVLTLSNVSQAHTFNKESVIDAEYGIEIFDRFNSYLDGDSVRKDSKGVLCLGWVVDRYDDNTILHRGYYVDGKLKVYKNYYPNGQLERAFKLKGAFGACMAKYFADGKLKSNVVYNNGLVVSEKDFTETGKLTYLEKSNSRKNYLLAKVSYYENGNIEFDTKLVNKKHNEYFHKQYYENGLLQEEGILVFKSSLNDFEKKGVWKVYNEKGEESTVAYF